MVEDHVLAIGNAGSILVFRAHGTHAEAHVAHDDIVGTRERHAVAIDGDAFARSRLSSHIEVVLKYNTRVDANHTAHVEYHDTVRLTDSIAQRTATAIVQIGHMVDRTLTATLCISSPALCTRECQLLGTHGGTNSEQC